MMKALTALRRSNPLDLLYTVLFLAALLTIFQQLRDRIVSAFSSGFDDKLAGQYVVLTTLGCLAGLVHHFSAYNDLGHIGSHGDKLSWRLKPWVNSRWEWWLRVIAVAIMVFALAKTDMVAAMVESVRSFAGYPSVPNPTAATPTSGVEQYLLYGTGPALAITLLSWSGGAYWQCKELRQELKMWVFTDLLAVLFWFFFLLFVSLNWTQVGLLLIFAAVGFMCLVYFRNGKRIVAFLAGRSDNEPSGSDPPPCSCGGMHDGTFAQSASGASVAREGSPSSSTAVARSVSGEHETTPYRGDAVSQPATDRSRRRSRRRRRGKH